MSEKLAARTKIKATQGLDKKDEIVANVIWRFLELRGYVLFHSGDVLQARPLRLG